MPEGLHDWRTMMRHELMPVMEMNMARAIELGRYALGVYTAQCGKFDARVLQGWGSMQQQYGTYGPGRVEGIRLMHNVRELGGYATADGRRVKRGLLVRGSRLANLADDELAIVGAMGIRSVLDLRAKTEAEGSPDPELPGARYLRVGGMYLPGSQVEVDFSPQQMREVFGADPEGGLDSYEAVVNGAAKMLPMYLGMPFDNAGFRALFELLLAGETPVYFHCAAGKDRTGLAALLVLLALGADAEVAAYDFTLTNVYRVELVEAELASHADILTAHPEARQAIAMLQGVNPEMPRAVLAEIERRYGTLERYFAEEFGLGARELAQLREVYTEA